jgi:xanthosine utilization system XapX-like protein
VINNGVPISSNLFHSGSLAGGMFRITYVSSPGNPVITFVGLDPTPTNLGVYGQLELNIFNALPLFDYTGIFSGIPNPGAITSAPCGSLEAVMWVNPGSIPTGLGVIFWLVGIDFPTPPTLAPNLWFHIANKDGIASP